MLMMRPNPNHLGGPRGRPSPRKDPKVFEDTNTQPATDVNFINYESGLSVAVMQEGFSITAHRRLCAKRSLDPGRPACAYPDAQGEI